MASGGVGLVVAPWRVRGWVSSALVAGIFGLHPSGFLRRWRLVVAIDVAVAVGVVLGSLGMSNLAVGGILISDYL